MEGRIHVRDRRAAGPALAATMLLALLPAATLAAPPGAAAMPDLRGRRHGPCCGCRGASTPWQTVLDSDGVVAGNRIVLRREGVEVTLRTGRRGFSLPVSDARLLVAERSADGTTLTLVDTQRACRVWERTVDGLAFETDLALRPG